jgi:ribosomal protein L44E
MGHYKRYDKKKVAAHYECSKCGRKHHEGDKYYRAHYQYSGDPALKNAGDGLKQFLDG